MPNVLAILPCLGRYEQTLELIPRLRSSAGIDFTLTAVVDYDPPLVSRLQQIGVNPIVNPGPRRWGYWLSLKHAVVNASSKPNLIVNLANDLLPGRQWLRRALDAYDERYGTAIGMIGFNDGIHTGAHAAHFLISSMLLYRWYGENWWPLHYRHNFGDTEICQRAIELGLFAVAPWAILYHNHPAAGRAWDEGYEKAVEGWREDSQMYEQKRVHKWT